MEDKRNFRYHSAKVDGITDLINSFSVDREICTSTSKSSRLFGRDAVIIFKPGLWEEISYCPVDKDAQKNYGWDESRIKFSNVDDLLNSIEKIVVSEETYNKIEEVRYFVVENAEGDNEYIYFFFLEGDGGFGDKLRIVDPEEEKFFNVK